jgi:hypothetical protein
MVRDWETKLEALLSARAAEFVTAFIPDVVKIIIATLMGRTACTITHP